MSTLDVRCPTCDSRPGEACRPDGISHIDRVQRAQPSLFAKARRDVPDEERARVERIWADIRTTLGRKP